MQVFQFISYIADKVIVIPKPKEIPPLKKPISFEELKRMTLKHAKETKSEVLRYLFPIILNIPFCPSDFLICYLYTFFLTSTFS